MEKKKSRLGSCEHMDTFESETVSACCCKIAKVNGSTWLLTCNHKCCRCWWKTNCKKSVMKNNTDFCSTDTWHQFTQLDGYIHTMWEVFDRNRIVIGKGRVPLSLELLTLKSQLLCYSCYIFNLPMISWEQHQATHQYNRKHILVYI